MRAPLCVLALSAATLLDGVPPVVAQETSIGQDLKTTILLHGMPCDTVVNTQRKGDSDYLCTCKDGNRYHVFVNGQGRVLVEKQKR